MRLLHIQQNRQVMLALAVLLLIGKPLHAQELLSPNTVPKFVNPLPIPSVIDAQAGGLFNITITQFEQDLGLGLKDMSGQPVLTTVWGYNGQYPGPTFLARKDVPVRVYWHNYLTSNADGTGSFLPHLLPVDASIHWALGHMIENEKIGDWESELGVPTVSHLHGGHTESESDGLPEAWYTPRFGKVGAHFRKGDTEPYFYHNDQEAATLWYHDHTLGITRLNVYAGLAGFYLLTDENEQKLQADNILPADEYDIEVVIQDRMFTTDGQLFYPSEPDGEMTGGELEEGVLSPSVLPEFFGDIILVNGKAWPKLEVEPREYRFRLLNGSDSRFYDLTLTGGAKIWQIGSDNGLLRAPVLQKELLIAPGERKEIVIDFSHLKGSTIIMRNDANTPFPDGDDVDGDDGPAQIMAFEVSKELNKDFPLTKVRAPLNNILPEPTVINPKGVKVRKLILFEGADEHGRLKPMLGTYEKGAMDWDDEITENPDLNATEIWEVYNLTPDAHPVHLHLVQFRVISSQKFAPVYKDAEAEEKGIMSDVVLLGDLKRPERGQQGKKDTYPVAPGEVTRLIATFDRPGRYVWHCHILSHEDHNMMRPYYVGAMPEPMLASLSNNQKGNGFAGENAFEGGMYSVYPNPFSTSATLELKVDAAAAVAVRLVDLSGRVVRDVPAKQLAAGNHQLEINAEDLQTGMYICEVEVNKKQYRSRIVLAR